MPLFKRGRRNLTERRVPAVRVIPAFNEVKDMAFRFFRTLELMLIEKLAFDGREEAFTQGVVVAITHAAHRGTDSRLATALSERERRVLAPLIRMMDHARDRKSTRLNSSHGYISY